MRSVVAVALLTASLALPASAQTANVADSDFVARMLQHHQDGIEMARLSEARATSTDVRALARRMRERQERDVREMKPFAKRDATRPAPLPRGTAGANRDTEHGLDHDTDLDKAPNALERLRSATGKDVDVAFLNEMAKHIAMAIQITRQTPLTTPPLKRIAEKMAAGQSKELEQLKATLKKIF